MDSATTVGTGSGGACCASAVDSDGHCHEPRCLYLLGLQAGRAERGAAIVPGTGDDPDEDPRSDLERIIDERDALTDKLRIATAGLGEWMQAATAAETARRQLARDAEWLTLERERLTGLVDDARAEVAETDERFYRMADQRDKAFAERDRLYEAIRKVREIHSPEPGWEREWRDPTQAPCAGCTTSASTRFIDGCRTLAALGDIPSPTAPEAPYDPFPSAHHIWGTPDA